MSEWGLNKRKIMIELSSEVVDKEKLREIKIDEIKKRWKGIFSKRIES